MVEFLASVIGALAAGALESRGIGGRAVVDAYDGLRALIVRKLGKGGAVQSVEDEPRSEAAQATLAEALAKAGLAADPELAQHADAAPRGSRGDAGTGGADIEVGDITGKVNVLVNDLVASGRIKLGDLRAETGTRRLPISRREPCRQKKPERRRAGQGVSRGGEWKPTRRPLSGDPDRLYTAGRDVNFGLTPEQVKELTEAAARGATGPLTNVIVDLSKRLGVTEDATRRSCALLANRTYRWSVCRRHLIALPTITNGCRGRQLR